MGCARTAAWGLGLAVGLWASGAAVAQESRSEPLIFRLANLTTAPESSRVGFAFDLEGPPLVDELPAGSLTTLLPGRADPSELWVLPRGQVLPKSLPEPLPLPGQAPTASVITVFLIDRPGPRGESIRKLVMGSQAPAEGAQLRILNLVGTLELEVCQPGAGPLVPAVPAGGLSRFTSWLPNTNRSAAATLTLHVASAPACRGAKLGAVQLRLFDRGAWTLIALPKTSDPHQASPALRLQLRTDGTILPERAVALPVLADVPVALRR